MAEQLEQIPFPDPEFVDNPEPRCPCVLIMDTSGSMNDLKQLSRTTLTPVQKVLHDSGPHGAIKPIDELNTGLTAFKQELMEDELAIKRVELSLITFGPVKIVTDFQSPDLFHPPRLNAEGDTPMGAAIEKGIELVRDRKVSYRQNGISYYRPWIFLISDGEPTDKWNHAADLVRAGEQAKAFAFFAVGVEGANFDILTRISVRRPLRLEGLRFREMFMWLSSSLGSVSRSTPGDDVPLDNPAVPEGWAAI
ncbi:MAG: hypothetical protein L0220_22150 [Acidobacteria bacterium]|nr:hypothetical protein [Acidobacteriota bacterium]